MNLHELPQEVQSLTTVPYTPTSAEWADFRTPGIGPQHISALVEISRHADEFWREDASDGEFFMPLQAWRALVQMQAPQAIPELLHALRWIDDERVDYIVEEFPFIFAHIEPSSAGPLIEYLLDRENGNLARVSVSEGLVLIAEKHPEFHDELVRVLRNVLEGYKEEDPYLNGFIISHLAKLNVVEAAPLVEQVYKEDRVDTFIPGDWEDFQVAVGLLEQKPEPTRSQSSMPFPYFAFDSGFNDIHLTTPYPDFDLSPEEQQKWKALDKKQEKKEKNKHKEAKNARKKHRKKK